jgi:hypothetical protein
MILSGNAAVSVWQAVKAKGPLWQILRRLTSPAATVNQA